VEWYSVGRQRREFLVKKRDEVFVFRLDGDAGPVRLADVRHDGEDTGVLLRQHREGRIGVEHSIYAAVLQSEIGGRMIVEGLDG
jgi:hypothetical protein